MPEGGENTTGKNKAKKGKKFPCKWSSCEGKHPEELKGPKPSLNNYPNDGKVEKGGYRDAWVAEGMCPWGADPPPASYQLPRYGQLNEHGTRIRSNRYRFQAHHLVPSTILKNTDTLKDNLILIGYDVDHKNNGMILPWDHMDQPIHRLPRHEGDHPPAYYTPIKKKVDQYEEEFDGICSDDKVGALEPQFALIEVLDALAKKAEGRILAIQQKRGKPWPLRANSVAEFADAEQQYLDRIEKYRARQKANK